MIFTAFIKQSWKNLLIILLDQLQFDIYTIQQYDERIINQLSTFCGDYNLYIAFRSLVVRETCPGHTKNSIGSVRETGLISTLSFGIRPYDGPKSGHVWCLNRWQHPNRWQCLTCNRSAFYLITVANFQHVIFSIFINHARWRSVRLNVNNAILLVYGAVWFMDVAAGQWRHHRTESGSWIVHLSRQHRSQRPINPSVVTTHYKSLNFEALGRKKNTLRADCTNTG